MKEIKIELTDTQYKGLEYAAFSAEDWCENVIKERSRIAVDEIVKLVVEYCLNKGEQLPTTREEIVSYGFANGVVKTGAQRQAEAEGQDKPI